MTGNGTKWLPIQDGCQMISKLPPQFNFLFGNLSRWIYGWVMGEKVTCDKLLMHAIHCATCDLQFSATALCAIEFIWVASCIVYGGHNVVTWVKIRVYFISWFICYIVHFSQLDSSISMTMVHRIGVNVYQTSDPVFW